MNGMVRELPALEPKSNPGGILSQQLGYKGFTWTSQVKRGSYLQDS